MKTTRKGRIIRFIKYDVIEGMIYLFLVIVGTFFEWLGLLIRLPLRIFVCSVKGHKWLWLGNGFFGMFAPKKPLKCMRCGKKGEWEEAEGDKYVR